MRMHSMCIHWTGQKAWIFEDTRSSRSNVSSPVPNNGRDMKGRTTQHDSASSKPADGKPGRTIVDTSETAVKAKPESYKPRLFKIAKLWPEDSKTLGQMSAHLYQTMVGTWREKGTTFRTTQHDSASSKPVDGKPGRTRVDNSVRFARIHRRLVWHAVTLTSKHNQPSKYMSSFRL